MNILLSLARVKGEEPLSDISLSEYEAAFRLASEKAGLRSLGLTPHTARHEEHRLTVETSVTASQTFKLVDNGDYSSPSRDTGSLECMSAALSCYRMSSYAWQLPWKNRFPPGCCSLPAGLDQGPMDMGYGLK